MAHFPTTGMSAAQIDAKLDAFLKEDLAWREGRVPLYIFRGDERAYEVGRDAFFRFFSENALGANRAFASIKNMQNDVIRMCLSLLNGTEDMDGIFTSGGTESIFLAMRAARTEARRTRGLKPGSGNVVLPVTAHPAFSKGAQCMDLEERRVPVTPDGRADVAALADAIDDETVMLAGSAPCFPYGVIDPITELGELALGQGLWLHVDACVGGYLAPFVRDIGYPVPPFDMGVPGVASLSADLHKYGFCPKPASTVFFSSRERTAMAGFEMDVWPSGPFVTQTLVGTRPAGGVAGAWATLHYLGLEGYRRIAQRIMTLRDHYVSDITGLAGYQLTALPDLAIVAFRNAALDMPRVAALMRERGWLPGMTAEPSGLHMMLSLLHEPAREQYITDLKVCSELASGQAKNGVRETARY